ncbi:Diguanylate Cyclase and Two-component system sensory domain-containing protein [Halomicrobium zhouii]|uniref:Diguanylate Cyclase and Two-component system sensory domain-containing protein n=1 Tax=Halomicrobium zhouii TaxID=767519 RepID=A0A1I6LGD8_9EURY|nr:DICT sensory domain-containing protein [Halomicrobium zhouii]SFS02380.1 Diguanylate Cyclase and Two-component system sensory domain-containing protein [Halomicrobium zhouii]
MGLADIIADVDSGEKTLTIRNRDEPEPIVRMLRRMVDAPDVRIREDVPAAGSPGNLVILEGDGEGTTQLAISSIADVGNSVLMVNSDLYITGTRSIDEVDTPDVLAGLDETTFTVSGKQKMLLIEISRHVEALAYRSGGSTLHTGFQHLSRIEDERGTRSVYERLVDADVSVHVYGTPDDSPAIPDDISVHADDSEEIRTSWFVVNTDCPDEFKGALLATEVGPNEWTGLWTFDPAVVDRVSAYLDETYGA